MMKILKTLKIYTLIGLTILIHPAGHAQENDSLPDNRGERLATLALPAALIAYGALSMGDNRLRQLDFSVRDRLVENDAVWNQKWDDYLQYLPAATAFGMKIAGAKSTHNLKDMTILYVLSNLLSTGIVQGGKHLVARERPDGSNRQSFPSGHTATAFVAAELLYQEYGERSVWTGIAGYSVASLVGVARICNNKHWLSDVVAGAGAGILSTKIAYWSYPYLQNIFTGRRKPSSVHLFPSYSSGAWGVQFSCAF
jgi:membrane-associated phospholipid phosphatase